MGSTGFLKIKYIMVYEYAYGSGPGKREKKFRDFNEHLLCAGAVLNTGVWSLLITTASF